MKKIYQFIVLFICILTISTKDDCSTPAECYIRAVATLNQDREEMRLNTDRLLNKANLFESKIESTQDQFKSELKNEILTLKEEVREKLNIYQDKLNSLVNDLSNLSNKINAMSDSRAFLFNNLRWMQIKNVATGKCLTDVGNRSQIIVTDCSEGWNESQLWKIIPSVEGWYSIHSYKFNFVDIDGGSNNNGTKIQSWDRNLSDAQRFYVFTHGSEFVIARAYSSKCLDVNTSTTMVQLWDMGNPISDNQRYKFIAKLDF